MCPSKHRASPVKSGCALLLVACLLFLPMFQGKVLFWADYFLVFHPLHTFARESLRQGEIPLWNPYISGGMPFLGNLQSALFYPLNTLYHLIPVHVAFGISALFHVWLFGFFVYLLLREWELGAFASLFASVTLMLSGFTVCRVEYPTVLAAAAWLPAQLLLVDRSLAGSRVSIWLLPLCIAAQLFAGHPQMTVMSFGVVLGYAVMRSSALTREKPSARQRMFMPFLIASIMGVVMAMVQMLPAVETLCNSARTKEGFAFASIYSMPPRQLVTLFFPNSFGNPMRSFYWGDANFWELTAYCGVTGFLFLFCCFWRRLGIFTPPNRARARFFAVVGGFALVTAMGRFTPLYALLYHTIPGFTAFKGPGRFLFLFVFSAAILAGMGAYRVTQCEQRAATCFPRLSALLITLIACLTASLLAGKRLWFPLIIQFVEGQLQRMRASCRSADLPQFAEVVFTTWLQDLITALIVLLAIYVLCRFLFLRRLSFRYWKAGIIVVAVAELLSFGSGITAWSERTLYTQTSNVARFLQSQSGEFYILTRPSLILHTWGKFVPFTHPPATRTHELKGLCNSLSPNRAMVYHIKDLEGYDPLKPAHSVERAEALHRALGMHKDVSVLTREGVRFVVAYGENLHVPHLVRVFQSENMEVYENVEWKPSTRRKSVYYPQSFRFGLFLSLVTGMMWMALVCAEAFTFRNVKTSRRRGE